MAVDNGQRRVNLPTLQKLARECIDNEIKNRITTWTQRLKSAGERSRGAWCQEIQIVREECTAFRYYLSSMQKNVLCKEVINCAIKTFCKVIASYGDNHGRPSICMILCDDEIHRSICLALLKTVIVPCSSVCNIEEVESDFVQSLMFEAIVDFPDDLKTLILPDAIPSAHFDTFVNTIQRFTLLTEFQFEFGCTRHILMIVTQNCPLLERLNVRSSKDINDESVYHLLYLTKLEVLDISETAISEMGYGALLATLANIGNITWFHPVDNILRNITLNELPSIKSFFGGISDINIIVNLCPNVENLTLLSYAKNVIRIKYLEVLQSLHIINSKYILLNFTSTLEQMGHRLTELKLSEVEGINYAIIVTNCQNLVLLHFTLCTFIRIQEVLSSNLRHFHSVKVIEVNNTSLSHTFSFYLRFYLNLEKIHARYVSQINDDTVRLTISGGGFRKLTEFVAVSCGHLCTGSASLLLEYCSQIRVLGDINTWTYVDPTFMFYCKAFRPALELRF